MKDIIITKLKSTIMSLQNDDADAFIAENTPENATINDYMGLLSKVQSGEVAV